MIKFIKGAFAKEYPYIPQWEEPVNRIYAGKKLKVDILKRMVILILNMQVDCTNLYLGTII